MVRHKNERSFIGIAKALAVVEKSIRNRHLITNALKEKRVNRATNLIKWMDSNKDKVNGWSDEKILTVDGVFNRRTSRILMTPITPDNATVKMVSKNPTKMMVWAMMTSAGQKMSLIIFPAGQNVHTFRAMVLAPMI